MSNNDTQKQTETLMICKHRIVGTVQNVGFRRFVKEAAIKRGVNGWAMNETDGSLVVLLSGDSEAVNEVVGLLHQGPPGANVVAVAELQKEEEEILSDGFTVR